MVGEYTRELSTEASVATCSSTALRRSLERFSSVKTPSTPTASRGGTRVKHEVLKLPEQKHTVLFVVIKTKLPETPRLFLAHFRLCRSRCRICAAHVAKSRATGSGFAWHHCGRDKQLSNYTKCHAPTATVSQEIAQFHPVSRPIFWARGRTLR